MVWGPILADRASVVARPRLPTSGATGILQRMNPSPLLPSIPLVPEHVSNEIYLDVETLRLSDEVPGGWSRIRDFGLAVAITWDSNCQFRAWFEPDAAALINELHKFSRIVTFNGDRFDLEVLSAYGAVRPLRQKSFDVLVEIQNLIGRRVKLDHVVGQTLGVQKTADGIQAVDWWRKGEKDKVVEYCCHDVELLMRLVIHARQNGSITIDGRALEVNWTPRK